LGRQQVEFVDQENEFGPTLAERVARRVRQVLDSPELSEWEDWLYITSVIFVDEGGVSDQVFKIISSGRLGMLAVSKEGQFIRAPPAPPPDAPEFNPKEIYSVIGLGDPPAAVPGLVDYLVLETMRQLRRRIRDEKDPLTRMGLSQIMAPVESLSFGILESGVLLQNLNPGQTMIIAGKSGSGKTTAAVFFVMAPWLARGGRVVSNIYIAGAPAGYTYVTSLSEYLRAILANAIEGYRTLAVRDEGALGRMKQSAMSERNRELKMLTMILRKFNAVEVTIYQYDGDVPSELRGFCTHYIRKISREKMFVRTMVPGVIKGLERRVVSEIPSEAELKAMGRPVLEWRTEDIATLVHDIKIEHLLAVLRRFAKDAKKQKDRTSQLREMLEWIEHTTGGKDLQFTEDQVVDMIQEIHYNKPEWGWQPTEAVVSRARQAIGRGKYWVHTTRQSLGIKEHKLSRPGIIGCDWCSRHRDADMV
jgi:hypothetical protein